ncbi:MAG: hypothetical protein LUI85_19745 [Bacteroides sp.]|nr:hypothetical protein [Bacteroides sp.]
MAELTSPIEAVIAQPPPWKATLSTHLVNISRRGGLNPPEPSVTTLGVMHKVNRFRADSICPYGGEKRYAITSCITP